MSRFELSAIIFVVVVAVWVFMMVAIIARTDSECLIAGYPNAEVTWNLRAYCIKRVNQTDVVIPLSEVRE